VPRRRQLPHGGMCRAHRRRGRGDVG
jgi:hypothetical protein